MIGTRIRTLRHTRGWTQEVLARASGLTKMAVSHIENDRNDPRLDTLIRIAAALQVPAGDLLPRGEEPR